MLYSKKNYLLMGASLILILIGFILMSGGQSEDPTAFSPEIFSSRRIVVAPIICLSGFILMIYAILVKPTRAKKEGEAA
ncbi:hypothetical protein HMPREF1556_00614 [Porphyromonas sp. oral taxon 278 str. W7784]|uniref:DUF3098 domain-containing protein n=1 Tax=Porphyromonas sp. oral taxon 278 TaxID=712437 RepID=UPI0003AD1A28|nr:DUF3098 domain-containing protein [Porphyromonas sp. oral taxon 278]ERJ72581.1 hypothetical protein HMPREF1556_00614 [Porphyromonas sp. oral taxon 278 str. W7784]